MCVSFEVVVRGPSSFEVVVRRRAMPSRASTGDDDGNDFRG